MGSDGVQEGCRYQLILVQLETLEGLVWWTENVHFIPLIRRSSFVHLKTTPRGRCVDLFKLPLSSTRPLIGANLEVRRIATSARTQPDRDNSTLTERASLLCSSVFTLCQASSLFNKPGGLYVRICPLPSPCPRTAPPDRSPPHPSNPILIRTISRS